MHSINARTSIAQAYASQGTLSMISSRILEKLESTNQNKRSSTFWDSSGFHRKQIYKYANKRVHEIHKMIQFGAI